MCDDVVASTRSVAGSLDGQGIGLERVRRVSRPLREPERDHVLAQAGELRRGEVVVKLVGELVRVVGADLEGDQAADVAEERGLHRLGELRLELVEERRRRGRSCSARARRRTGPWPGPGTRRRRRRSPGTPTLPPAGLPLPFSPRPTCAPRHVVLNGRR